MSKKYFVIILLFLCVIKCSAMNHITEKRKCPICIRTLKNSRTIQLSFHEQCLEQATKNKTLTIFDTLKNFTEKKNSGCIFCSKEIRPVEALWCGHVHCQTCIRDWLQTQKRCPTCNMTEKKGMKKSKEILPKAMPEVIVFPRKKQTCLTAFKFIIVGLFNRLSPSEY